MNLGQQQSQVSHPYLQVYVPFLIFVLPMRWYLQQRKARGCNKPKYHYHCLLLSNIVFVCPLTAQLLWLLKISPFSICQGVVNLALPFHLKSLTRKGSPRARTCWKNHLWYHKIKGVLSHWLQSQEIPIKSDYQAASIHINHTSTLDVV